MGAGSRPCSTPRAATCLRTLATGPNSLNGFPSYVATSPNPKVPLLAVALNTDAGNGRLEIWSTATWKEEFVLATTSHVQYTSLAFSPDGTRLAVERRTARPASGRFRHAAKLCPRRARRRRSRTIVFSRTGARSLPPRQTGRTLSGGRPGPELGDLDLNGSIESVGLSANRVAVASLYGGRVEVSLWTDHRAAVRHFTIPGSSSFDVVSVSPDVRYVADFEVTPGNACPESFRRPRPRLLGRNGAHVGRLPGSGC